MNLAEEIRRTQVSQGELMICWLGQAGYLLKDGHGCTLAVDPYLTNCGERIRGFKRLSPMLLPAEDFAPDYYVITHTHFDHLDYDAIPVVKERSPKTQFFGPTSCLDVLAEMGVEKSRCHRLDRGMRYGDRRVLVEAATADHGTMAPDAIGVLLEMGGHRLPRGAVLRGGEIPAGDRVHVRQREVRQHECGGGRQSGGADGRPVCGAVSLLDLCGTRGRSRLVL